MESYILTRSMHLGFLKESFGRGSVLTFNPETRTLTIDGRRFDDYRDLDILKRQAEKKPHDPWVIPYTVEALQKMRGGSSEAAPAVPKRASNSEGMEIVQSDEDMHDTIDISNTKISERNQARKEEQRQKVKDEGMPIVRGDESVEDRIARLKEAKETDLAARAERVRLMSEKKASMPIVHDDSLGVSGKESAMNAGMPVGGKRPEETPESVRAAAEARKASVEANRQKVARDLGMDFAQAGIDEVSPIPDEPVSMKNIPPAPTAEEMVAHAESVKDLEIAALRAKLAELEGKTPVVKTPVVSTGA